MALYKVGSRSALPVDTVVEVRVGGRLIALCNTAGVISALAGNCPHRGGPLGHGAINEEGRLVCPWHLWEFDCLTGEYDRNPKTRVETFEVKLEGDDIYVEVP